MTWAPCCGWRVMTVLGAWMYAGESSKEKFWRMEARPIFASTKAKPWPTQTRGPPPKGKKAVAAAGDWFFDALETPSANLSGLKSPASSPQYSGSCWTSRMANRSCNPAGKLYSPTVVAARVLRERNSTGGYSRSTSWRIIVTCNKRERERGVTRLNLEDDETWRRRGRKKVAHNLKLAQSVEIRLLPAENLQNLDPGVVLPVRMHS